MADGPAKKSAKKAGKKAAKTTSSGKKAAPAKKAGGAKKAAAKKAPSSGMRAGKPGHQQIAERAYDIHEREGGDAVGNWLRAERELSDD